MDKILTIVIPSYNMEKYLDRCLSSLIVDDNHMQLFEALVINDGSKDRTSEIAHQYESLYPKTFHVIDKENGHYGSCVNRGLTEAKGRFVKILDADDAFDNQVFRLFLDYIGTGDVYNQADVIISDYSEVDSKGSHNKTISFSRHDHAFYKKDLTPEDKMKWFIHGLTYNIAILRELNYHQTEGISYTDQEWAFFPMASASVLFSFDKPLYLYSKGVDNQSIAPNIHAKDLWMEMTVIKNLIMFYINSTASLFAKEEDTFLHDRLIIITEQTYHFCLLTMRNNKVSLELLEDLDRCFKTNCPEEYSFTDKYKITIAGLKFYPIRNWREGKRFALWFQNAFYDIVDWYNKLRKRI